MGVFVVLLRGINVGGANRLPMADLRSLATAIGLGNPRTLLQSGNMVVDAPDASAGDLEARLEAALAERLGLSVDVVVRDAEAWRAIVDGNPLAVAAAEDPAHLVVVALKSSPSEHGEDRLRAAISGPEVARVIGRHAYIQYPDGIGPSRLTQAVIDRALGARGTARNWNTVLKIGVLAGVAAPH